MDDNFIDDLVSRIDLEDVDVDEDEEDWSTFTDISKEQTAEKNSSNRGAEINVQEGMEKTEEQKRELEAKNMKKMEKDRRQRISSRKRRIRYSPPGLKIFQSGFFHRFTRSNLCIENDIGYDRRDYLKTKTGLTDEKINEIFSTPWQFIMFLCPATTSPMIKTENDFIKIADYLYFMHVSTKSSEIAAITKKALFQLLKNYGYTGWKLGLKHLVPTFLNLGMEESTILNQDIYDEMLQDSRPKTEGYEFKIEGILPEFFTKRFQEQSMYDILRIMDDFDNF